MSPEPESFTDPPADRHGRIITMIVITIRILITTIKMLVITIVAIITIKKNKNKN